MSKKKKKNKWYYFAVFKNFEEGFFVYGITKDELNDFEKKQIKLNK